MTSAPTAPRTIAPRPRQAPAGQPAPATGKPPFTPIPTGGGHRVVIYGPGGIGKTTLACLAPGPIAFFDLDDSLGVLRSQLPDELQKQINRVGGAGDWQSIRDTLHMSGWDEIKTIVIDSATKAEELALAWTLKHVQHEKGTKIERIEDYGYGKGYQHLYETFLTLLGDLDQHVRAGRNVVLICHDCTATVPNPNGEDWIRYEPRLQSPNSGKSSIRLRVREWADHVLFIGYDMEVKDGKASPKSCESRTLYPVERPHCMAKSRVLAETFVLTRFDGSLWEKLLA